MGCLKKCKEKRLKLREAGPIWCSFKEPACTEQIELAKAKNAALRVKYTEKAMTERGDDSLVVKSLKAKAAKARTAEKEAKAEKQAKVEAEAAAERRRQAEAAAAKEAAERRAQQEAIARQKYAEGRGSESTA